MEYAIHRISLDINSGRSQATIRVKRGETKRKLYITLREGGVPYQIADDCEAYFSAIKPDGQSINNSCDIVDNTIIYTFTTQTTPVVGTMDCEIILYDGKGEIIISPHITLIIENGTFNGDAVISTPEANALDKLLDRANSAIKQAEGVSTELFKLMANSFKGNKMGAMVRLDDISPIEHTVECKVESKNLYNDEQDYVKTSETVWTYENGTLFVANHYVNKFIPLIVGKTYTFSCKSTKTGGNGGGVYLRAYTEDRANQVLIHYNTQLLSPTITFTMPEGYPILRLTFYGDTIASTNSATYTELMLEEGNKATPYVPYINVSKTSVKRYGKNLFTTAGRNTVDLGASATSTIRSLAEGCIYKGLAVNNAYDDAYILSSNTNDPANITFKTSNAGGYGLGFSFRVKPGDTYTLSAKRTFESSRLAFSFYDVNGTHLSFTITPLNSDTTSISAIVPTNAYWMIALLISTVADTDVNFKNVQLEVGDIATAYAPYVDIQTYTSDTEGVITGMASLYPDMAIFSDTANTIISCEYSRDSNKVYKELYDYLEGGGLTGPAARIADVTILASAWKGTASPYSQVVSVDSVTPYTQVDLTPSAAQLAIFHNKDLAFVTENEDGVITVYAIGQKPTNDYTIQATLTEVMI